ncbi:MAG: DNA polymerase III subunit delta', partial [Rhodothermales bacterium]
AMTDYVAFEGAYKVITLTGAEDLGQETGNVLLKLFEEPSERTVFILTAERPGLLLPTIFSRCQSIRFDPLVPDEIQKELVAREGLAESEAMALSRLADGSFSTARDLLHDELARAYREGLVDFLRSIYANDVDKVMKMVDELSKQTRDQIKLFLSLLMILVRDLVLVRELGPDAPIVNVNERAALIKFTSNLESAKLEQMVNLVEEAWYLVTRNVRPSLILMSLAAALRASMKGRPALPLVTPLAEQILSELE